MTTKHWVTRIATLLLFFVSVTFTQGQNFSRLYKKCLPAVVKISTINFDGTATKGTGFFIDEKTIVTCYHIADNVNTMQIESSNGQKFTVDSIIASNRKTDLIKFTVKEKNKTWFKLSDKLPKVGESVFIIGNPGDYDFSISSGIVSSLRRKNSVQVIQNTAPCSPGNSGSPVLNKKGKVIGVMSYVMFVGQNLNFAATSLNVINMQNDSSIKQLTPVAAMISRREMDSIVDLAKLLFSKKDYKNALNTILPVTKFADTTQSLEFTELIANCHLFNEDYSKAAQYYELLITKLNKIKSHTPEDVLIYAQTLNKTAICYFVLGDVVGAIDVIKKTEEVCKSGLKNDTANKLIYTLLIQQVYAADATYNYSLNNIFEACLSWKIAKQYGYKKDDYGFDTLCK
jgi:V8-like Glu-specific endopeptidase